MDKNYKQHPERQVLKVLSLVQVIPGIRCQLNLHYSFQGVIHCRFQILFSFLNYRCILIADAGDLQNTIFKVNYRCSNYYSWCRWFWEFKIYSQVFKLLLLVQVIFKIFNLITGVKIIIADAGEFLQAWVSVEYIIHKSAFLMCNNSPVSAPGGSWFQYIQWRLLS